MNKNRRTKIITKILQTHKENSFLICLVNKVLTALEQGEEALQQEASLFIEYILPDLVDEPRQTAMSLAIQKISQDLEKKGMVPLGASCDIFCEEDRPDKFHVPFSKNQTNGKNNLHASFLTRVVWKRWKRVRVFVGKITYELN